MVQAHGPTPPGLGKTQPGRSAARDVERNGLSMEIAIAIGIGSGIEIEYLPMTGPARPRPQNPKRGPETR
jgi:hypothetical protein